MRAPAKESRIALGALIIKERLGITDEETVAQIRENPFLQYFLGLHEYLREDLFDSSMMAHFPKRISAQVPDGNPHALLRFLRALIQQCHAWLACMMIKLRDYTLPSLLNIPIRISVTPI